MSAYTTSGVMVNVDGENVFVKIGGVLVGSATGPKKPELRYDFEFPTVQGSDEDAAKKRWTLRDKVARVITDSAKHHAADVIGDVGGGLSVAYTGQRPVDTFGNGGHGPIGHPLMEHENNQTLMQTTEPLEKAIRSALNATKHDASILNSKPFANPSAMKAARELLSENAGEWRRVGGRDFTTSEGDFFRPGYFELPVFARDVMSSGENRPELVAALNQMFLDSNIDASARLMYPDRHQGGLGLVVEVRHEADYDALATLVNESAKKAGNGKRMPESHKLNDTGQGVDEHVTIKREGQEPTTRDR